MSLKSVFRVAAVAVALCATVAQADPLDLAVNGGFETGDFTGWVQFPTGPDQQTIITDNPAEGTYAACIFNNAVASNSLIKNANVGIGEVEPGETVTIEFDARGAWGVGAVAFAEFFSEIEGGGTSAAVILGGGPLGINADPEVWTHFVFTAVTGPDVSGGVTLQLGATTAAIEGSVCTMYYDNASITVEREVVSVEDSSWGTIKNLYR